jgi:hypothetical protein
MRHGRRSNKRSCGKIRKDASCRLATRILCLAVCPLTGDLVEPVDKNAKGKVIRPSPSQATRTRKQSNNNNNNLINPSSPLTRRSHRAAAVARSKAIRLREKQAQHGPTERCEGRVQPSGRPKREAVRAVQICCSVVVFAPAVCTLLWFARWLGEGSTYRGGP